MRVSAEERRSREGLYRWRSSEGYCGPVPVITLKQSVETLYCIRALIGNQYDDRKMGWTWSSSFFFSFPTDKLCSCLLNSSICQWEVVGRFIVWLTTLVHYQALHCRTTAAQTMYCYRRRQTLTSSSSVVLCLMRIAHARFLPDT